MPRRMIRNADIFHEENERLNGGLPFSSDTSLLSKPLPIRKREIPNRMACQAMEGCDGTPDGRPGDLTVRRYDRLAEGGAGLIWVEATAVQSEARANPRQLCLNKNTLDSFRALSERIREKAVRANGKEPLVIVQLTHSGRYSRPESKPAPLIAYNNPLFEKDNPLPSRHILSDSQLDEVGEALVEAAVLAEQAGFDGADIKACHRYLLSELLSAYQREGRYGGSFENRTRLLTESVRGAIQSCGSDFIVTTRLNIYDGFPYPYGFGVNAQDGLTPDFSEPIALVRELEKIGMPLINLTMGNPYVNPHVNRPYLKGGYLPEEHPLEGVSRMLHGTAAIQRAVPSLPVICSGPSFLAAAAPQVTAACIEQGWFAMAGYGRQVLAYPDFARDIVNKGELNPKQCCITCGKCSEIMRAGSTPGCVVYDKDMYLPLYQQVCGGRKASM